MDHIHEWRQRWSLCKIKLDNTFFLNWFLKSLLPSIAKDMASEQPQIEEESILKYQQFDLTMCSLSIYIPSFLMILMGIPLINNHRVHPMP